MTAPAGDQVFAAFCAAGLWPGLGKRTAAELPAAGITSADDVTAERLLKLPRVGKQRAERLFSSFLSAAPTYDVVALLVGAGLDAKLAAGTAEALGPDAARRLRDALEPIATQGWWAREVHDHPAAGGLGFLENYVWGRAAALGEPTAEVVTATFGVFEPGLVAALLGAGRDAVPRADMLRAREEAKH